MCLVLCCLAYRLWSETAREHQLRFRKHVAHEQCEGCCPHHFGLEAGMFTTNRTNPTKLNTKLVQTTSCTGWNQYAGRLKLHIWNLLWYGGRPARSQGDKWSWRNGRIRNIYLWTRRITCRFAKICLYSQPPTLTQHPILTEILFRTKTIIPFPSSNCFLTRWRSQR